VSPCQIWSKSAKARPRYGDFSIFQDGGRRRTGFLKFQIFTGRTAQEGLNCITLPNLVEIGSIRGGDMAIFQFLQRAAMLALQALY